MNEQVCTKAVDTYGYPVETTGNAVLDTLEHRSSTRAFARDDDGRPVAVTDEQRAAILHAASRAPSAGAMMMYSIVSIREQATLDRLADLCDHQPMIAKAPWALIFVVDYAKWIDLFEHVGCFEPEFVERTGKAPRRAPGLGDFAIAAQDAVIAAQNAVVAAEALGLRSCYIGDIVENAEEVAELLADGILTPAVTVTTAIEGLRTIPAVHAVLGDDQGRVVAITLAIIIALFLVQRIGTAKIGHAFGPIMTLWFLFLGGTGLFFVFQHPAVLLCLNPVRGIAFLLSPNNHAGIMILGSCFLATTGAEALYSDMGHVGRGNIYATWPFVKCCLLLSYMGQGAWLMTNAANPELMGIADLNPFYQMLAPGLRPFAVGLSTVAAIIASQALITGAFSLVSEASRLDLMPHMQVFYPAETKGQLYIPMVNNVMLVGCVIVVLLFQNSAHMEAAYGLAITLTMMCTTLLLFFYLHEERKLKVAPWIFAAFFLLLEGFFFVSSLTKFFHGGYFTILMAALIMGIMVCWYNGTAVEQRQFTLLPLRSYLPQLKRLRDDDRYERLSDNIVYLTKDTHTDYIDRDIVYSILDKHPKRARAWWFVNVETMDEPHTFAYSVETFGTDYVFRVHLYLGYKINQRVNAYLRQVVQDLAATGELPPQTHDYSVYKDPGNIGTFKFVLIRKLLAPESDVEPSERTAITLKYIIRRAAGTPARWYGLENSNVSFEYVPLFTKFKAVNKMQRLAPNERP